MANMTYGHPSNVTEPSGFFLEYTHTVTGSLWGYLILLAVFSISFLALSNYNSRKAFAASSFTTFVSTVILANFQVVGGFAFTLTALLVVLAILVNRDSGGI
jgi:hypothetical protein